jgi:hypothetical protein
MFGFTDKNRNRDPLSGFKLSLDSVFFVLSAPVTGVFSVANNISEVLVETFFIETGATYISITIKDIYSSIDTRG